MKRLLAIAPLCLLFGLALLEVTAHALTRLRVPPLADYRAAAVFVRAELQPGDLIVSAPSYTDPLLRQVLGDAIDLPMAGRSDTAGYSRLWELSIGGARANEAARARHELSRSFGRVTVTRSLLGEPTVVQDLTLQVRDAEVSIGPAGAERPCPWRTLRPPRGGGLGPGVLAPAARFACDAGAWVAPVVQEDLALQPRYCVRQAVAAAGPLRVTLRDVPLGERLVLYGGLYYEDERMRRGAPVLARVLVAGNELGRMQHRDGEGWKRAEWATSGAVSDVTIEVSGRSADKRSFCWAATTRRGAVGSTR